MSGAFFLFQPFPSGPGAGRFPLGRRRRRRLGFRSPPSWTPSASAVPGSLSLGFSGRRSHSLLERCWPSPWERLSPPDAPSLRPPLRRRRRPSPSPLGRSPSGSGGRSPLNTASRRRPVGWRKWAPGRPPVQAPGAAWPAPPAAAPHSPRGACPFHCALRRSRSCGSTWGYRARSPAGPGPAGAAGSPEETVPAPSGVSTKDSCLGVCFTRSS